MYAPPKLKHYEGSWIICEIATGKGVMEVFRESAPKLAHLNVSRYEAVPVGAYLARLNAN